MSQNNAKPADKRKGDPKSWVVMDVDHKPTLLQTTWLPGYTPLHKGSRTEAVGAALMQARKDVEDAEQRVLDLERMRREVDPIPLKVNNAPSTSGNLLQAMPPGSYLVEGLILHPGVLPTLDEIMAAKVTPIHEASVDIAKSHSALMERKLTQATSQGWTSHGHRIEGVPQIGPPPIEVARCGGYGVCKKCSREVNVARMNEANKK